MIKAPRLLAIAAVGLALGGCGVFTGSKDKELEPVKLTKIETKLKVRKLWTASLGKDAKYLRLALRPTTDGNLLYAASADGRVTAIEMIDGDVTISMGRLQVSIGRIMAIREDGDEAA